MFVFHKQLHKKFVTLIWVEYAWRFTENEKKLIFFQIFFLKSRNKVLYMEENGCPKKFLTFRTSPYVLAAEIIQILKFYAILVV